MLHLVTSIAIKYEIPIWPRETKSKKGCVLEVVENNLFRIKAHRVDFELFYVNGLELLWHCEYYEDENSVFGTIEYSARNRVKEKSIIN